MSVEMYWAVLGSSVTALPGAVHSCGRRRPDEGQLVVNGDHELIGCLSTVTWVRSG
jgi:hypothetical protein